MLTEIGQKAKETSYILGKMGTDLKNAGLLLFAYFPKSICILIIGFFPIALMMLSDYFAWFWFLYGFSFPGFFVSMIVGNIFANIEEKDEKTEVNPDGQEAV